MDSNRYLLSLPNFSGMSANGILGSSLTASQASQLKAIVVRDSCGVFYSGLISLAQGLNGIGGKRYAWSTVKMYYAAYYFLRAYLLASGWCQFYVDGKPRAIEARVGSMPQKLTGTSHESCYRLFSQLFPKSVLISQDIGIYAASDWLKKRREEVNYQIARFTDPEVPWWFEEIVEIGVRRAISEYMSDPTFLAFAERHAMVSYPTAAALEAVAALRVAGATFVDEDQKGFALYWRDVSGQLPGVDSLLPS